MAIDSKNDLVPNNVKMVFLIICAILCLTPFVGMLWAQTTTTTENRVLADAPSLLEEDGSLNESILSDLGGYFEDHFAYRNQLVAANAYLRTALLGTSPSPSVIYGQDGWLYYEGTLGDYSGTGTFSERGCRNIAFNLELMQGYVKAMGASLAFTIAPNKNTLYPEHMPYYELAGELRTIDELGPLLEEGKIDYVDLFEMFDSQEDVLYYKKDSHWNTLGSLLACKDILRAFDQSDESADGPISEGTSPAEGLFGLLPSTFDTVEEDSYVGDLNRMLYPDWQQGETDFAFDGLRWTMVEGKDVESGWIETVSDSKDKASGSVLLMYRDSFANNMIPFLSSVFDHAYYTKMIPYDLTQVRGLGATNVIIERAERHLPSLNESPAIMPAPTFDIDVDSASRQMSNAKASGNGIANGNDGTLSVAEDGPFLKVSGRIPDGVPMDTEIYLAVQAGGTATTYVPFHVGIEGNDFGFLAYLPKELISEKSNIMVIGLDESHTVYVRTFDMEGKVIE